jgi:hypothetical protein
MRGQVCLLYMLLALASIVFLGSESLGTRDHILLSQILDLPFRRLLRLAGSRWRYSNPPPHGSHCLQDNSSARTKSKTPFFYCCARVSFRGNVFTGRFQATDVPSRDRHIATVLHATIIILSNNSIKTDQSFIKK